MRINSKLFLGDNSIKGDHHLVTDTQGNRKILSAIEQYVRNVAEDVEHVRSLVNENQKQLEQIDERVQQVHLSGECHFQSLEKTVHDTGAIAITTQMREKIFTWLYRTDPHVNHNAAIAARYAGTGLWFIDGDEHRQWENTPNSFLWLHGIPGSGKTVLWYVLSMCPCQPSETDQLNTVPQSFNMP
jgi:hypothetical protein